MKRDLTIQEKIKLLTGRDVWNVHDLDGKLPEVSMCDGPHGCRSYFSRSSWDSEIAPAHNYPSLAGLASSWNTELARLQTNGMADDFIEQNRDICLAPGINLKRSPLCGRNFEYFSEDPVLTAKMAVPYIEGLHERGIGSCVKHFCANNSDYDRTHVSSNLSEATLMNAYGKAFKETVKAKPWMVMCSYNRINGVYASENKYLLNTVLRKEFGFDGVIVSDWQACQDRTKSLRATLDLAMPPKGDEAQNLERGLARGAITEADIDASANRILEMIDRNERAKALRKVERTHDERHALCKQIASECVVLLKNDGVLPLSDGAKLAVCGSLAEEPAVNGGGAAYVVPVTEHPLLTKELQKALPNSEIAFRCGAIHVIEHHGVAGNGLSSARRIAENADISIVVVGTGLITEYEGRDRKDIKLSTIEENLIRQVSAVSPKTVVVLESGSAIDVSAWIDDVDALMYVPFIGEATNEVLADILTGKVNPSGKLAETFPLSIEDCYCQPTDDVVLGDDYTDGEFIGYRHFDRLNREVAFPFGYGLSYSAFEYSNLSVTKTGDTDFSLTFDVTNTSGVDGKEVCQIYVKTPTCLMERPVRALVDFVKISLKAGETASATVKLTRSAFEYYLQPIHDYYVENGNYTIEVGASSRDVRLAQKVNITLPEDTQFSYEMRQDW